MRVAIITTEKPEGKFPGLELTIYDWAMRGIDSVNLRDFDGVILDVESSEKSEVSASNRHAVESKVLSPAVLADILSVPDSFFVILGKPSATLFHKTFSTSIGVRLNAIEGTGKSLVTTNNGKKSPFANYLSNIKQYDYSYEGIPALDDYYSTKFSISHPQYHFRSVTVPLLTTRANHSIAFTLNPVTFYRNSAGEVRNITDVFKSPITFLPSLQTGARESLEMILKILSKAEANEAPEWVDQLSVVGQETIDEKIDKIKARILTLQGELEDSMEELKEVRAPLDILYLSDKPLEEALKTSFDSAGFKVLEPGDGGNNVEFYLEQGTYEFVVEVKSTEKATFSKDGMRQVNEWRENEALDTGKDYKPLLILSNEYSLEPSSRNKEFIASNLISYAESRKIAVISVVVLYEALQMIKTGAITKEALSTLFYEAAGIITSESLQRP